MTETGTTSSVNGPIIQQQHQQPQPPPLLPAPVPAPPPTNNDNNNAPNDDPTTPLRTLCADLHARIATFLQEDVPTERLRNVQAQCRHSLAIISEALQRYPLSSLSLSYNGGKDCLVLLILYLSLLPTHPSLPRALPAILIPPPHPFPAVDAFVAASSARYHLALSQHTSASSMKAAFADYLASSASSSSSTISSTNSSGEGSKGKGKGKGIQAIMVGTRRTDPHGATLSPFDPTDHGWPAFMRVHPVLEWRYAEVWAFLRHLRIEYCALYDEGYTSLGGTNDTRPNPRLRVVEAGEGDGDGKGEGRVWYRPAYELEADEEERLGRDGRG